MAKAILFDIENTLLCPEVPAVQPRWTLHALAELAAVTAL